MENLTHYPVLVFAVAFLSLSLASAASAWLRRRNSSINEEQKDDLSLILAASLTLLALIIGFSFSMATNRYEQRKTFEEAEANAIGTELLRADLLPPADASSVRKLLGEYLNQRIVFFINKDDAQRARIDERIGQLETDLWAAVRVPAQAQPTPVAALVLAGMNDVINSQGYTQAAYWNRIPTAAWCLMVAIALCSNVLFGYRVRNAGKLSLVLPLVVSISLLLIADRCSAAWPDTRQSAEP
jgi:dsDNA-binding SOS-regulon protein